MSNIFKKYQDRYDVKQPEEMTLEEYLEGCKTDRGYYASAAERMLMAIGEPEIIDTRNDERLSRIWSNRKIKTYKAFADFYGVEEPIQQIVSFLKHAAQSLEEENQILYLLGPVGGGKSSLAERLKELMQRVPIYTIKAWNQNLHEGEGDWEISPLFESPLGLFDQSEDGQTLEEEYGIPSRYLKYIMSPWAVKRLREAEGDLSKFKVVKIWPDILQQVAITKVEPGDENNQDISSLVGKVNISDLEDHDQNDPDAYNWVGGLNVASQGIMEFVEMFKAPIKMLHPLLTATQEGHYNGTEQFGAIPFSGIILAHSNESEWTTFRNNKNNEAFLDRVNIVKVPYCLRVTEESKIYEKLLANSELSEAPCAPGTIDMMAQYSILTRLIRPENSTTYSKMEVYDGKNLKDTDPSAKSIDEYKEVAGVAEGMQGSSTRFAFKILSKVFNYDSEEIAADPIHLMYVLEQQILQEQFSQEEEEIRIGFIKGELQPRYAEFLEDELQKAYLESYHEYGQNLFDRYIQLAGYWIQDKDYRDDDTGTLFDRDSLNDELEKIEKPAGIGNPKDFRNEVVMFVLRASQNNNGKNPDWTSYQKLRDVIEKKMFANTEELLPVISFQEKQTADEQSKHDDFVTRMMAKGYTEKQVRRVVDWFLRYSKNN
jgi:serine protein kinase